VSMEEANRLLRRMERATERGRQFEKVLSDCMKMFSTGEITLEEGRAVNRAAGKKLREFSRELQKEEAALRLEFRAKAGL
jgi:hypothetical protein